MTYQLIRGDATALPIEDDSVDAVITSPPYYSLRSYTDGGEHYDGRHPAPHWCHKCGKLGCFDHHGLSYGSPTATPRPARDTDSIARRRRVLDALARIGRAA